jgi:hypothetical protein
MDPKFLVNLQGRTYPLYAGVLAEAHARGLLSISVDLVQVPSANNDNTAIVKAVALFKEAGCFEAYGDASPRNTKLVGALIRMAETRAKGRCLRDACNIGETLLEELPDNEGAPAQGGQRQPAKQAPEGQSIPSNEGIDTSQPPGEGPACTICGHPVTKGRAAYCVQQRASITHTGCA